MQSRSSTRDDYNFDQTSSITLCVFTSDPVNAPLSLNVFHRSFIVVRIREEVRQWEFPENAWKVKF